MIARAGCPEEVAGSIPPGRTRAVCGGAEADRPRFQNHWMGPGHLEPPAAGAASPRPRSSVRLDSFRLGSHSGGHYAQAVRPRSPMCSAVTHQIHIGASDARNAPGRHRSEPAAPITRHRTHVTRMAPRARPATVPTMRHSMHNSTRSGAETRPCVHLAHAHLVDAVPDAQEPHHPGREGRFGASGAPSHRSPMGPRPAPRPRPPPRPAPPSVIADNDPGPDLSVGPIAGGRRRP